MEEFMASPNEFAEFMSTYVYRDYLTEITIREAETVGLLEDVDNEYSGRDYDRFRGRLKNLREMKDIFIGLMENKENDIEKEDSDDS